MPTAGFRQRLDEVYGHYLNNPLQERMVKSMTAKSFDESTELVPMYSLQNIVRPLFGKGEAQPPDIGDHPDFLYLKGTNQTEHFPITTLFMDIESSTRLSLLYPLEAVYRIKNSFIRAAMEIIKSFDGHVHRVMGDAVMAFFGGKNSRPADGIIDALNCASVLRYFVEAVVIPRLSREGYDDPLGIRLGLDYGDAGNVLWSSYGYPGMDEVTATSYYVDIASKLQHSAGRNQIMVGQSLVESLAFPDDLLIVKKARRNGTETEIPFVEPNHTDRNGNSINYKQFILDWKEYLLTTPVAFIDEQLLGSNSQNLSVTIEKYSEYQGGVFEGPYFGSGSILQKGLGLKFIPKLNYVPKFPYTIKFRVENHGEEAKGAAVANGREAYDNHVTEEIVTTQYEHNSLSHWEHTHYKGLHYMNVEVYTHRGLTDKATIGVYVI